ncbi:hypothetical protein JCM17843_28330 [Kordiimonadales bacterium JCM 17843]|nr:hypothetical protein JCM17843_28330 [Kordiimonadales bacterium JCM 17843]
MQGDRKAGLIAGEALLNEKLAAAGQTIDQFVFSFASNEKVAA